jgi:hypothetical protein
MLESSTNGDRAAGWGIGEAVVLGDCGYGGRIGLRGGLRVPVASMCSRSPRPVRSGPDLIRLGGGVCLRRSASAGALGGGFLLGSC